MTSTESIIYNYSMERCKWLENISRGRVKERAKSIRERLLAGDKGRSVFPSFVFMGTSRCTLKCKHCYGLIPNFTDHYDISVDTIKRSVKTLLLGCDELITAEIGGGGEPMLYPQLIEALNFLVSQEKIDFVLFSTNGTIPANDKLLDALDNEKCFVLISDYGVQQNTSSLIQCFEKKGIDFCYNTNQHWVDAGEPVPQSKTIQQLTAEFANCSNTKFCKVVIENKIYSCARSARMHLLGVYEDNHDYNEFSENCPPDEINSILKSCYNKDYAVACDYCNLASLNPVYVEAGKQPGKKLSNYTYIHRDACHDISRLSRENQELVAEVQRLLDRRNKRHFLSAIVKFPERLVRHTIIKPLKTWFKNRQNAGKTINTCELESRIRELSEQIAQRDRTIVQQRDSRSTD